MATLLQLFCLSYLYFIEIRHSSFIHKPHLAQYIRNCIRDDENTRKTIKRAIETGERFDQFWGTMSSQVKRGIEGWEEVREEIDMALEEAERANRQSTSSSSSRSEEEGVIRKENGYQRDYPIEQREESKQEESQGYQTAEERSKDLNLTGHQHSYQSQREDWDWPPRVNKIFLISKTGNNT